MHSGFTKHTTDTMDIFSIAQVLIKPAIVAPISLAFDSIYLYGPLGPILVFFGSRTTWRLEAQVLGSSIDGKLIDSHAFSFKQTVSDECTMISVAVSNDFGICIHSSLTLLRRQPWWARSASRLSPWAG